MPHLRRSPLVAISASGKTESPSVGPPSRNMNRQPITKPSAGDNENAVRRHRLDMQYLNYCFKSNKGHSMADRSFVQHIL